MSVSPVDPDSTDPYTDDEWNELVQALFAVPVDASTLRTLLGEALGTLSVLATGDLRPSSKKIITRRLRRTRITVEQVNQREAAV